MLADFLRRPYRAKHLYLIYPGRRSMTRLPWASLSQAVGDCQALPVVGMDKMGDEDTTYGEHY